MGDLAVTVSYRETEDGWHIFTSNDVPNLLVASPDRMRAFNDVPRVLRRLHRFTTGIECTFTPEYSAEEFFGRLRGHEQKVVLRAA